MAAVLSCGSQPADVPESPDASTTVTAMASGPSHARELIASLRARPRLVPTALIADASPVLDRPAEPEPVLPAPAFDVLEHRGDHISPAAPGPLTTLEYPTIASTPFRVSDKASGASMVVRPLDALDARAEVVDGYVVYRGALAGADMIQRPTSEGTEDYVVLDKAPASPHVRYRVSWNDGIAAVRMIGGVVELLDSRGAPRLRMGAPYLVEADGSTRGATVELQGCAYDTNPAGPWGRPIVAPGADACVVEVSWPGEGVKYPAVLDPSWTSTGGLSTARYDHTATTLQNGKVLIAGGASYLATCELYDPSTGTWATTGSLIRGRYLHSADLLSDGRVLVAGGYSSTYSYMYYAELYNPATGTWASTGSMYYPRYRHISAVLGNGKVLVASGYNSTSPYYLASAELYDPALGTWALTGSLATGREYAGASLLSSGRVLVSGGYGTAGYLSSAEQYNPAAGTWSSAGTMLAPRGYHPQVTLPNGKVLISGGYASAYLATSELYDPGTNLWTATGSLPSTRYAQTMTLLSNKVLTAGGYNGTATSSALLYDPALGTWTPTVSMLTARYRHTANLLSNGRVLVAGGYSSITSAELYSSPVTCATQTDCAAGTFCVDGYCCDTPCTGGCDRCDLFNSEGTCRAVALSAPGANPSCFPLACDGVNPGCPASCSSDAHCTSGYYCSAGGQCLPKLAQGSSCTLASQCQSGYCADGFCCSAACSGGCDVCSAALGASVNGTCTNVTGAGSPSCSPYLCSGSSGACPVSCTSDTACVTGDYCRTSTSTCMPKQANATTCTANNQCTSSLCVDGYCCNGACGNGCDRCDVTGYLGQCHAVAAGNPGYNPTCAPYVCDGNPACPTSCSSDAGCSASYYCSGNACVSKKANGQSCTATNQCSSGFCVDGYCCGSGCAGPCNACAASMGATANGTCTNVTGAGSPSCGTYVCLGSSASCPTSCTSSGQCSPGNACINGACAAKLPDGASCNDTTQCTTGNCVDGKCCNAPCAGACDACAASLGASADGVCTLVSGGGSPSCSPYLCTGASASCPTTCSSHLDCFASHFCEGGQCLAKRANGLACAADYQCTSTHCADGVCCNTTCDQGGCDQCALPGSVGTCKIAGPGAPGQDPSCAPYLCNGSSGACSTTCAADASCAPGNYCTGGACLPKGGNGTPCTAINQCQSGKCVDGVCCDSDCTGGCNRCDNVGTAGTCTVVGAANPGYAPSCAPYVCDGVNAGCPISCAFDSDCVNAVCIGQQCVPKLGAGGACTSPNHCQSGFCVDGFCCNSACDAQCEACNLPAAIGTCLPQTGAPFGSRPPCDGAGTDCGGHCNGSLTTACTYPNATMVCKAGSCSNGVAVPDSTCDGAGNCVTPAPHDCSPYVCDQSTCLDSCVNATQCVQDAECVGGQCKPTAENGQSCSSAGTCKSGFCVDGVCCNESCQDQCAACNVAGSEGTCTASKGSPAGARPACAGEGACAGACDGTGRNACAFPAVSTVCKPASCTGGRATAASTCDGKGACAAGAETDCGAQGCDGDYCTGAAPPDAGALPDAGESVDGGSEGAPLSVNDDNGGCGCRTTSHRGSGAGAFALLGLAAWLLSGRRRGSKAA